VGPQRQRNRSQVIHQRHRVSIFGEIDGLQIESARLAASTPHLRKLLAHLRGGAISPLFRPQWAISAGAGRGLRDVQILSANRRSPKMETRCRWWDDLGCDSADAVATNTDIRGCSPIFSVRDPEPIVAITVRNAATTERH